MNWRKVCLGKRFYDYDGVDVFVSLGPDVFCRRS